MSSLTSEPTDVPAIADPEVSAHDIGLTYLLDSSPGITRQRCGRGFTYRHDSGRAISRDEHCRIDNLAVPPAWTDVWISPDPRGHLQATGRDNRGRKQYLYHDDWRIVRDRDKFEQLATFGHVLPDLRRGVAADLRKRGVARRKVLALLVHLLDTTLLRVGNEVYVDENETYGLTTLRPEHAEITSRSVMFCFIGKSGAEQTLHVDDRRVARLVRHCRGLGGEELFSCRDRDGVLGLTADDVNGYLHEVCGGSTTARDFRSWGATAEVAAVLGPSSPPDDEREAAKAVIDAVDHAAARLGNTRAVCRDSYIHPALREAYLSGELANAWRHSRRTTLLSRSERTVLAVLDA